jgi:hypothetical protein
MCATCLPITSSLIWYFPYSPSPSALQLFVSFGLLSDNWFNRCVKNTDVTARLTQICCCLCSVKTWRSYYSVPYVCCRFWTRRSGELRVQEVDHDRNLYWISNTCWFFAFIWNKKYQYLTYEVKCFYPEADFQGHNSKFLQSWTFLWSEFVILNASLVRNYSLAYDEFFKECFQILCLWIVICFDAELLRLFSLPSQMMLYITAY